MVNSIHGLTLNHSILSRIFNPHAMSQTAMEHATEISSVEEQSTVYQYLHFHNKDNGMHLLTTHRYMRTLEQHSEPTLMGIPTEMRLEIYTHALRSSDDGDGKQGRYSLTTHCPYQSPLLETTEQIRYEATPIFYAENHFVATLEGFEDIYYLLDRLHELSSLCVKQFKSLEIVLVDMMGWLLQDPNPLLYLVKFLAKTGFNLNPRDDEGQPLLTTPPGHPLGAYVETTWYRAIDAGYEAYKKGWVEDELEHQLDTELRE